MTYGNLMASIKRVIDGMPEGDDTLVMADGYELLRVVGTETDIQLVSTMFEGGTLSGVNVSPGPLWEN